MKVTKHVEQLLRQGRKPKELIELGFPKSTVTRVYRQLKEEKATLKVKAPEETAQAETHLQIPPESPETIATIWQKVQSMANDLQRIDSLIQALSEGTILMVAARDFGIYRYEACPYRKDSLCTLHTWSSEGEIPAGIGEPVRVGDENPEWGIKPSPLYCVMCTTPLENRIDDIEDKASDDPLWGARYQITCENCGTKGWVAVKIKCTKCGHETYFGWQPKKE
jgi:hypothetical protein